MHFNINFFFHFNSVIFHYFIIYYGSLTSLKFPLVLKWHINPNVQWQKSFKLRTNQKTSLIMYLRSFPVKSQSQPEFHSAPAGGVIFLSLCKLLKGEEKGGGRIGLINRSKEEKEKWRRWRRRRKWYRVRGIKVE